MEQRFTKARRTVRIHATAGSLALLAHDVSAAHRTSRGHAEFAAMRTLFDYPHDLRYDIAATLYQHGVADFYVQSRDLIFVMERGTRNGYATDVHGPEMSH